MKYEDRQGRGKGMWINGGWVVPMQGPDAIYKDERVGVRV